MKLLKTALLTIALAASTTASAKQTLNQALVPLCSAKADYAAYTLLQRNEKGMDLGDMLMAISGSDYEHAIDIAVDVFNMPVYKNAKDQTNQLISLHTQMFSECFTNGK